MSWREWAGYYAASQYADHHDIEYNAIREAAALIDVSPLFKYVVGGPDARRLVDRVITRDATKLTPVANYLVDQPTLKALHMINADPKRTMSFTMFSNPDYYFQTFSPCPVGQGCLNDAFAWIHGDYSNDIGQTWLGIVLAMTAATAVAVRCAVGARRAPTA